VRRFHAAFVFSGTKVWQALHAKGVCFQKQKRRESAARQGSVFSETKAAGKRRTPNAGEADDRMGEWRLVS